MEVLDDLYLQAPSGDGRGAWKQARSRAPVTGHRQPGGPANASRGVGGVALVRVTGGGWADPENTADAPAARREAGLAQRIFLLHIWKCGGTQFCAVARANGESVNPDWGCHMPEPSRKSKWTPCADGRKFEEEFPQRTFVASECPLGAKEPIGREGWMSFVVLRDPVDLATSWYRHASTTVLKGKVANLVDWARATLGKPRAGIWFTAFEDNLQTRWLCGWKCNNKPWLSQSDFEKAKENLRRFDVVLRLEDVTAGMQLLEETFLWNASDNKGRDASRRRRIDSTSRQFLDGVQNWDKALYEFSKTLPQR